MDCGSGLAMTTLRGNGGFGDMPFLSPAVIPAQVVIVVQVVIPAPVIVPDLIRDP